MTESDGYAILRVSVQEIGGAVQRINNPFVVAALLFTTFFSQNGMIRVGLTDDLNDGLFRHMIHF
jgi:hypothetical protein